MSNRAWMPLHITDYLADTGHLTGAEHGAYLLLIMHYWQNGGLPENERLIARIAKMDAAQWEESRDIIAMLFGENWTHKRIDAELSKADDIIEKRKAAAEARFAKGKHGKSYASAMHVQSKSTYVRVPPTTDNLDTSSLRSEDCPEPEKSAPASPTVIELPATQGAMVAVTQADVDEWSEAFPAVDVRQQLREMRQWLLVNEKNRKTARGMRKFAVAWLTRRQDRGSPSVAFHHAQAPPAPRKNPMLELIDRDLETHYASHRDDFPGSIIEH